MCHEASGVGLKQSIGVGKGTIRIDDFEKADAIFVFGQNPCTNHPRMLHSLKNAARRARARKSASTPCPSAGWKGSPIRRIRYRC